MQKKLFIIIIGLALFCLNSCKQSWSDTDKNRFMLECNPPKEWGGAPGYGKDMCLCIMEKLQQKYSSLDKEKEARPDESGAIYDAAFKDCLKSK